MNLGIYVHIPFCVSKCAYCAFYSEEYNLDKFFVYIIYITYPLIFTIPFDLIYDVRFIDEIISEDKLIEILNNSNGIGIEVDL